MNKLLQMIKRIRRDEGELSLIETAYKDGLLTTGEAIDAIDAMTKEVRKDLQTIRKGKV